MTRYFDEDAASELTQQIKSLLQNSTSKQKQVLFKKDGLLSKVSKALNDTINSIEYSDLAKEQYSRVDRKSDMANLKILKDSLKDRSDQSLNKKSFLQKMKDSMTDLVKNVKSVVTLNKSSNNKIEEQLTSLNKGVESLKSVPLHKAEAKVDSPRVERHRNLQYIVDEANQGKSINLEGVKIKKPLSQRGVVERDQPIKGSYTSRVTNSKTDHGFGGGRI